MNYFKNKLILGGIFLLLSAGLLGVWYWQKNSYSKEILKLEILAPEEAILGQEIEYTVRYKNNGDIRLEDPRLTFEYPENSLLDQEESPRKEIILESIYPGQEEVFTFKARLLGKEGEMKKAKAWLNYQPKSLKARYESETSHSARITSVPLNLEFDLPSKIDSGKEISFQLNYFSNVNYPLTDLGIKIEYPTDFEFLNSKPKFLEKTEYDIGLLNKAEGGRAQITGNLSGEVGEQKQFKAQLGAWRDGQFIVLKETVRAVQIVAPSLYISQQINNTSQYVARAGDVLHYEILFKNIGNDVFSNLFLVVKLEGDLFDFTSIKAPLGEFESGDNSIVFDWRQVSKLQFLDSQEEGRVEFWINLKDDWPITNADQKNQLIKNKVFLSQAQREFATKINSKLSISQQGYYADEAFGNSGPNPPQSGLQTTYTVIWQAKNYYSDVKGVRVKATLDNNVRLTGRIFPEDSRLTFDSNSREVVWELDNLEAGRGVLSPAPSVAFQIALTPASFQQGSVLGLIGAVKITGQDEFTDLIIDGESPPINTAGIGQ